MATWTITEVGSAVLQIIDNVPTNISGALPFLAAQSIKYIETYTGQTVGSTAIPEQFQGPVMNLTAAKVSRLMALAGGDKTFTLGDLSVQASAGASSNETVALGFEKMAVMELQRIGTFTRYGRTY